MKTMTKMILAALMALPLLAGCKKAEEEQVVEKPAMSAPTTDDRGAWVEYLNDVVPRNMGAIANQPYVYFLPGESEPDFQDQYDRMLEKAQTDIARGILSGNMLAYASPASAKMADIVIASFEGVEPDTMKGVRLVFIGKPADGERVRAAVEPAGVTYVFVDTSK